MIGLGFIPPRAIHAAAIAERSTVNPALAVLKLGEVVEGTVAIVGCEEVGHEKIVGPRGELRTAFDGVSGSQRFATEGACPR